MKYLGILIIVCISIFFSGCDNSNNSIITTDYSEIITNTSSVPNVVPFQNSFEIIQSIDGIKGGSIKFDTTFVDSEGDTINFQINLSFLPNSFSGERVIRMVPDFDSASVSFAPAMIFDKPAFLNLSYEGIDLANLGFDSNAKADFVYISDSGVVEYILNDESKINWLKSLIYVKQAKLPHFSRYVFVRKSE